MIEQNSKTNPKNVKHLCLDYCLRHQEPEVFVCTSALHTNLGTIRTMN